MAGVIGCDIEAVQVSNFLQSLKIGDHGLALIINDKKELVAFPDPTKVIDNQGETGTVHDPVRVDTMDNASIGAAYREYLQTGQGKFAMEGGGVRYSASFTNFPPIFGKPWQVVVVVPEDVLFGEVKNLSRRVFFIVYFS